jgi:hypothetical protein
MFVTVAFTLDYDEENHPLYLEAVACFHLRVKVNKYRKYKVERAKTRLLTLVDYLFNPEVTNNMEFSGIEKRPDLIAKKQGLDCPEYPLVKFVVVWKRREDEYSSRYQIEERV